MSEPDPLQEAIKRAREIAAKLPPKQTSTTTATKRTASELEDVGEVKVYLAYPKVDSAKAARQASSSSNNDELSSSHHRSPSSSYNHHSSSSNIGNNNSNNNNNNNSSHPSSHHNRLPQQQHHQHQQQTHYTNNNQSIDNNPGAGLPLTGANAYPRGGEEKIEIIIPHTVIGLVIGKGGENIKRIQSETGATVRVDPNTVDEQGNKVCTITGTKQAVTEAHSQVTQVIENAATNKRPRMQVEGGDQFRMKIPASRTGAIIGKGGETIKQIKQQSGCDIELDKNSKDQEESVFIIRGTPDKITKARGLIEARLASRGRDGNDHQSGGVHHHKYHATGANATPVAQYTDLPTSYGGSSDASAAWNAYFAQYSQEVGGAQPTPGVPPISAGVAPISAGVAPISAAVPTIPTAQPASQAQDYTDQWIEYYLAVGRPDYAEQTLQMKKQQQLQQQQ